MKRQQWRERVTNVSSELGRRAWVQTKNQSSVCPSNMYNNLCDWRLSIISKFIPTHKTLLVVNPQQAQNKKPADTNLDQDMPFSDWDDLLQVILPSGRPSGWHKIKIPKLCFWKLELVFKASFQRSFECSLKRSWNIHLRPLDSNTHLSTLTV